MAHSDAVNLAILEALKAIEAKLDLVNTQPVHEFITQAKPTPKAKAKPKAKVAKTSITLPEGWQAVAGMKALRTKGYNAAKALGKSYRDANIAGLTAVAKALA